MDGFSERRRTKALKRKDTKDKYGVYSNKHLRIIEDLKDKTKQNKMQDQQKYKK